MTLQVSRKNNALFIIKNQTLCTLNIVLFKGIAQNKLKTSLGRQRRLYVEERGPLSRKLK